MFTDTKLGPVLMVQARQPLADRNRREPPGLAGRKGAEEDLGIAELLQELATARNTIAQSRKKQGPYKQERQDGWRNSHLG
jgi:hypothetical protein